MLKYHQFRARLGMGDLHPGGAPATLKILRWLTELDVRRVLEVGAGIGNTAARMAALGWDVTAIEPDPVLFDRLRSCLGVAARCEQFLDHRPAAPYDAVVAESVFFQMNLADVLAHTRTVLRPGGYLAFIEAVWTENVDAATSRQLHETTQQLFGIAVGSREPMTWRDWSSQLTRSGFETVHAELLPRGSAGLPPTANWPASIAAMLRDPRLGLWSVRYRARKRIARMPPGVQESRIFLGRSLGESESSDVRLKRKAAPSRDASASDGGTAEASERPNCMWAKAMHLFTERRYASRALAVNLPVALRGWLRIDTPMLTEDRRVLEQIIFAHYGSDPRIKTVLFVGCDWYTAHYQRRYFTAHNYWTIDPDATRRRFGAKQHIVARLEEIEQHFPSGFFDLIICNGVYGWGLDRAEDCEMAMSQSYRCLAEAGHLLLGWNDIPQRDPAPLSSVVSLSRFSPYPFPAFGTWQYLTDTPHRHRYNFYQKKERREPTAPHSRR